MAEYIAITDEEMARMVVAANSGKAGGSGVTPSLEAVLRVVGVEIVLALARQTAAIEGQTAELAEIRKLLAIQPFRPQMGKQP